MEKKEKVRSEYEYILRKVMVGVYIAHNNPRLVDYEQAVADYKTQEEGMSGFPYDARSVHTQVYRAMKSLEKQGVIVHEGKYYYPAILHAFYSGLENFKKNVKLAKDTVAMISPSTFAIALEPGQDIRQVKESTAVFFNEEKVFKLLYIDDTLIIILNDFLDDRHFTYLTETVKDAYNYQNAFKPLQ